MNTIHRRRIGFALLLLAPLAAVALHAGSAPADPPHASSASASASAPPAASVVAPPAAPLASLGPVSGWPTETSPKPKPEEWAAAPVLSLPRPAPCATHRVREWVRVSCRIKYAWIKGVRILSGPTNDAELTDYKLAPGDAPVDPSGGRNLHGIELTFPVRRGDRRLYEIVLAEVEGRYTVSEDALAIVSAAWLPVDEGPTIVMD